MSFAGDARPIGIFDSGVGGLTVLKALYERYPEESYLYLGDTARLPYGTKSPETIVKYSQQIINYLYKREVKAIVIACNSASSVADRIKKNGIPVFNVIEPGASHALALTQNFRIGVVGTRTTVTTCAYPRAIAKLSSQAQVFQQACPLWVPLAEEGWINDPVTNLIVYRYLSPFLQSDIDTLILGCTHYPILKASIARALGPAVQLVDSGTALADLLAESFARGTLVPNKGSARLTIMATDTNQHFAEVARRILDPIKIDHMDQVDI